jgi:Double zinc ribbon domain
MDIGRALVGILLPERCLACGRGEELLCADCRRALIVLRGILCARCGCPTAWRVERCGECAGRRISFASARAAVAYEGPARALVTAWKERGLGRVAGLAAGLVAQTACGRARVRSRRRRPRRLARGKPGRGARPCPRSPLGASRGAAPGSCAARPAPTRPHAVGPPRQRALGLSGRRQVAKDGGARRRCVHDRGHGRRRGPGAAPLGRESRPRRHVRPHRPPLRSYSARAAPQGPGRRLRLRAAGGGFTSMQPCRRAVMQEVLAPVLDRPVAAASELVRRRSRGSASSPFGDTRVRGARAERRSSE